METSYQVSDLEPQLSLWSVVHFLIYKKTQSILAQRKRFGKCMWKHLETVSVTKIGLLLTFYVTCASRRESETLQAGLSLRHSLSVSPVTPGTGSPFLAGSVSLLWFCCSSPGCPGPECSVFSAQVLSGHLHAQADSGPALWPFSLHKGVVWLYWAPVSCSVRGCGRDTSVFAQRALITSGGPCEGQQVVRGKKKRKRLWGQDRSYTTSPSQNIPCLSLGESQCAIERSRLWEILQNTQKEIHGE